MSPASPSAPPLVDLVAAGLRCRPGGFHLDPREPVPLAVLTHAHADHALPGSQRYLAAGASLPILERRLPGARIEAVPYGRPVRLGETSVSFHPAGHVLGSAQVRIEHEGEVWVVSGDYKRTADPTCEPFEVVRCDTFVTESTFALPIYRWPHPHTVARDVLAWWDGNRAARRPSLLFGHLLGKLPRLLALLAGLTDREVLVHAAVEPIVQLYRDAGVPLLPTRTLLETERGRLLAGELILAPPSALGTKWMKRFPGASAALASGWMQLRGARRRKALDRGFVLSDHADWPELLRTIEETGARRVLATGGHAHTLARYLSERGLETGVLETPGEREGEDL